MQSFASLLKWPIPTTQLLGHPPLVIINRLGWQQRGIARGWSNNSEQQQWAQLPPTIQALPITKNCCARPNVLNHLLIGRIHTIHSRVVQDTVATVVESVKIALSMSVVGTEVLVEAFSKRRGHVICATQKRRGRGRGRVTPLFASVVCPGWTIYRHR